LAESHKLDPHHLYDEGPQPKSGKSRLNLPGTIVEGKPIGLDPKAKGAQRRAHDFENQDKSYLRSKARSKSRIQFASNESKLVPRNSDPGPHLKSQEDISSL
jgi:hypothetical protein